MSKTTKMKFAEDKFINGKLAFPKGRVCEVPDASVDRWIKRGGEIVTGEEKREEKKEEVKLEEPKKEEVKSGNKSSKKVTCTPDDDLL